MKLYAIGDWVQRERSGLAHYVESIVAGDVVTRCGRRLSDEPTRDGGGLVVSTSPSWPVWGRCSQCQGKAT